MEQKKKDEWQPSFIGIGAMKAASAWLFNSLVEHPEIARSNEKELHFFDIDVNYNKGIEFYRSHFSSDEITGEVTPSYLYDSRCPERIAEHFPTVKLIACLRDPAQRAWSHYQYALQEQGRLSAYSSFTDAYRNDSSLSGMGRYGEQLQRYFKCFDKEQIKVIFYEDIQLDPLATVQDLYQFIGVKNIDFSPSTVNSRRNQTGDRIIRIRHQRTWRMLVSARNILSKQSGIEAQLVQSGIVSKVKQLVRRSDSTVILKEPRSGRKIITARERQMVVDDLVDDINLVESLTGRDLSAWRA